MDYSFLLFHLIYDPLHPFVFSAVLCSPALLPIDHPPPISQLFPIVATHLCSVPRTLHWLQHCATKAWVKMKWLNKPSGAELSGAGGKLHGETACRKLMSNLPLPFDTKCVPEDIFLRGKKKKI